MDLDSQKEWTQSKVPHVSGYIEEMAHNFVDSAKVQFGWEMVGWNLGIKVTRKIAGNPVFRKHLANTRTKQKETFERYKKGGYVFPEDIPANLCDRIHAYILWVCEKRYNGNFWKDFFAEVKREQENLKTALSLGQDNEIRNKRYQITIDCFDRLDGIEFKKILEKHQISLTTDIKSLDPEESQWNRKFH